MQPYFRLFDLPTELVDVVYEYALVSGNLAILYTSRRVHSEAMKFLYQSAFLHIHYEEPSSEKLRINVVTAPITALPVTAGHISIANMQLVQNLDICVDFDVDFLGLLACLDAPLASFIGSDSPPRKTCFLRIKNFEHKHKPRVSQILHDMSGLVNFQILYVIASTGRVEEFIQLGRYVLQRMRNAEIYEMAKEGLEATLGPSVWYDSNTEAGKYLEFHPLEYQKSL